MGLPPEKQRNIKGEIIRILKYKRLTDQNKELVKTLLLEQHSRSKHYANVQLARAVKKAYTKSLNTLKNNNKRLGRKLESPEDQLKPNVTREKLQEQQKRIQERLAILTGHNAEWAQKRVTREIKPTPEESRALNNIFSDLTVKACLKGWKEQQQFSVNDTLESMLVQYGHKEDEQKTPQHLNADSDQDQQEQQVSNRDADIDDDDDASLLMNRRKKGAQLKTQRRKQLEKDAAARRLPDEVANNDELFDDTINSTCISSSIDSENDKTVSNSLQNQKKHVSVGGYHDDSGSDIDSNSASSQLSGDIVIDPDDEERSLHWNNIGSIVAGDSGDEGQDYTEMQRDVRKMIGSNLVPKRRNRMGQRARQRMAESLYGGKAKHILNPKLDANRRRREKLELKMKPGSRSSNPKSVHKDSKRDNTSSRPPTKRKKQAISENLAHHPSWQAKQQLHEQAKVVKFEGQRIAFSDSDGE